MSKEYEFIVEVLNTIECVLEEKSSRIGVMKCRLYGIEDEPIKRFSNVTAVSGNIAVIPSETPNKIWIKTQPYIGMRSKIKVVKGPPMKGDRIEIEAMMI